VIDEAAHARYLKDAWERAISPTLTDFGGDAWFISTPNGMNYFYELFRRGGDPTFPDWASFHMPTSANPHIDPAEVEQKRRELPDLVFRQEYLAEFVTFGGGLVKPEMLADAPCPPGLPVVLGVDLAISERAGADYTAIVALARDPETGIVYVKEAERHRCGFHDVIQRIKAAAARHNPRVIAVEQTQYQAAVVQELTRTTTLPVRGIRPDKDKVTRFLPVLTRYEQRLIRHDPSGVPAWFRDELLSFPEGEHDDGADALAYAFAGITSAIVGYGYEPVGARRWSGKPGQALDDAPAEKWSAY
jgi:predicted phage terminase large subunit-like protein